MFIKKKKKTFFFFQTAWLWINLTHIFRPPCNTSHLFLCRAYDVNQYRNDGGTAGADERRPLCTFAPLGEQFQPGCAPSLRLSVLPSSCSPPPPPLLLLSVVCSAQSLLPPPPFAVMCCVSWNQGTDLRSASFCVSFKKKKEKKKIEWPYISVQGWHHCSSVL